MKFGMVILAGWAMSLLAAACGPAVKLDPTPPVDTTWERIHTTGRIVVGTAGDYAPFEYYNDQYRLDGFDVALIQAIGQKLGLRVELNDFAFQGLAAALMIGQVDAVIAAISVTDEREALMDFSDVYHVGQGVALAREGSGIGPLSSITELAPYRVGVQGGTVYQAELARLVASGAMLPANLLPYADVNEGVADLQRGAVELFLLDDAPAREYVAEADVEIAGEGVGKQRYAIALPQGATTLKTEVNRALMELTNDGTIARLSESYLGTPPNAILPEAGATPGPTPTPSAPACVDGMARIEDLSYDDDSMRNPAQVRKGEEFDKGWRIRNVGTCPWTGAYYVRYVNGNSPESQMDGAPASIAGEVQPGQTYDMRVRLKAPEDSGTYQGFWQLFNDDGEAFGETLWVGISVPAETPSATATSTPAATAAAQPTTAPLASSLVGPTWVLMSIQDHSGDLSNPVPGAVLTAVFTADGAFSGSTSCNSYTGNYETEDIYLKITDFSFTRDACPTDELNDQENRFLLFMEKATRQRVEGNQLQLFRGDNVTLVFQG